MCLAVVKVSIRFTVWFWEFMLFCSGDVFTCVVRTDAFEAMHNIQGLRGSNNQMSDVSR